MIYLDNNATTQIDERVLNEMLPYFTDYFGNSSSIHHFGEVINKNVEKAREQVATLLGASPKEIIFTSGATEGINLGIKGAAFANQYKGKHIITCKTEHKAVLDTCQYLEQIGFEVTYLPVGKDGLISIEELRNSLTADTILVSIMWVNNETGIIQPIQEIIDLTHQNGSLFFTDATQAVGKIPIDVYELDIDLLCLSAHKFYGPKGVGGLYVKKGIKLDAQTHGGGHEFGLRSGTSNVPAIIGLGKACEIAFDDMEQNTLIVKDLRDLLEKDMLEIPNTFVNGSIQNRLYNVSNISFPNIDANVLIGQIETLAISNGSACTAAIIEPSHVLKAMGLTDNQALGAIRFSLGKYTTKKEIKGTISLIKNFVENYQA